MEGVSPRRRLCKIGGYTRDRRGCLTCRNRKKKCQDAGSHQCTQCTRLNLKCVWEHERHVVPGTPPPLAGSSKDSQAFISPLPLPLSSWSGIGEEREPARRRAAMRYYIQDLAGILSTTSENNGFLSVLLPMAMESKHVMDALIAWSTSHMAMRKNEMTVKALEDRNLALRSFAAGLQSLVPEIVVAICLILTSMEAVLGNTVDWYHHLSAAASVIRSTLQESKNGRLVSSLERSVEGQWLLRNFAYHDILASVSLDCDLLIPGLQWLEETEDETVDTYLGLGSAPMALLGEVNSLSHCLANNNDGQVSTDAARVSDTMNRISEIEQRLLQWHLGYFEGQPLVALAESYRSAALIHLYRIVRSHGQVSVNELQAKIAHRVDVIVQCMTEMPVGCLPECTLLFPMFMAGGETCNVEYQAAIESRMEKIAQERHFANVSAALDVLKEVWSVRLQTRIPASLQPIDWYEVLKRRKWSLALS